MVASIRMSTSEALRAGWLLLRRPLEVRHPHHLQVLITNRCHLACAGCVRTDPSFRPSNRDMSLAAFEGLLERLRPREVTLVGEGDPLLHAELPGLLRAARSAGARTHLASNLSVGDARKLEDLLEAGLDTLRVQLAHSASARFREIKGRDLFASVLERLDLLIALRARRRARGPTIVLEFWIEPDALDELCDHLRLAQAHGIERVQFLARHAQHHRGPLHVTAQHLASLDAAAALARELGLHSNLDDLRARAQAAVAGSGEAREGAPDQGPASCALPWLRAFVDLDGRLGPCADFVTKSRSHPELDPPRVLDNGDPRPYDGSWMRDVRAHFKRGEAPHAICVGCTKGRLATLWNAARLRAPGAQGG
jgi:MoaA/NifB/PqqE/SkfB family radical SAM enzyme